MHRTADEDELGARIVELGNGRSVAEIVEILYHDELRSGAWIADIGIWSHLFARTIIKLINQLADEGHLLLKHDR